jgi:hypothetical protein
LQSPTRTYGTPAASISGNTSRFGSGTDRGDHDISWIDLDLGTSLIDNDEAAVCNRYESGPSQDSRLMVLEASHHLEPVVARHVWRQLVAHLEDRHAASAQ